MIETIRNIMYKRKRKQLKQFHGFTAVYILQNTGQVRALSIVCTGPKQLYLCMELIFYIRAEEECRIKNLDITHRSHSDFTYVI